MLLIHRIFYINIDGVEKEEIEKHIEDIKKSLLLDRKLNNVFFENIFLPIKNSPTHVDVEMIQL